jgi:hypothetical protein
MSSDTLLSKTYQFATLKKQFVWFPKRNIHLDKWLWLEYAYRGEFVVKKRYDVHLIYHVETHWLSKKEYIMLSLKGSLYFTNSL